MSSTASAGTAERLIAAIEEAAEFPELDDDHAKELCLASLRKIVDVVREGYKLKLGGEMSDIQWASVLRKADSAITEFCDSAMEESVFDGRNAIEFALPEDPSNHIKLELSMSLTRKAYDGLYVSGSARSLSEDRFAESHTFSENTHSVSRSERCDTR